MKKLPTGKVVSGDQDLLRLTDGRIERGRNYSLPPTEDGKTVGKFGKVTDIRMAWYPDSDGVLFWVRLEDSSGQGWQFSYEPE
jgi:hypothetical protein